MSTTPAACGGATARIEKRPVSRPSGDGTPPNRASTISETRASTAALDDLAGATSIDEGGALGHFQLDPGGLDGERAGDVDQGFHEALVREQ
jgi:hypothetical protein